MMLHRAKVIVSSILALWLVQSVGASSLGSTGQDTRNHNLAHGRVVFSEHCMKCHEQGRKGAPMPDEAMDWVSRLEQSLPTLIDHAIGGHGDMPMRGDTDLSDQNIAAATAYVVDRTRKLVAEELGAVPPSGAGGMGGAASGSADDAVLQMFLMMIGKERWK
jgi:cytochrome c5